MNDEFLHLRITAIKPELTAANRVEASSYFLESIDGKPVLYQAGQFLTLIIHHQGHEVRRSYSLSSAPGQKKVTETLRLTIKRVTNGEISRYLLDTLRVGDVLTCLHPAGRFTLDNAQSGDLVFIGAGSGITPLFSLLKQVLYTEPDRRVTLLYSNSSAESILLVDELADLHRQFVHRFRLIHQISNSSVDWTELPGTVRIGRLNNIVIEQLLPELLGTSDRSEIQFYVCGPTDYMRMVQFTLTFSGTRPDQIRRENFVIEPVLHSPPPALAIDRTIRLRFRTQTIDIQVPAYKSILQAALDKGIKLPYSCRGGRCSACVARCLSGSVHMTINDVLTERDLADGLILTCTGYPESDGVAIEV